MSEISDIVSSVPAWTVLVIEDYDSHMLLAKRAVEAVIPGVQIQEAYDGESALELLKDPNIATPHLILLDLMMPIMDGHEFLEERGKLPELQVIPVIMMSTSSANRDITKSFVLGANSYLVKPALPDDFQRIMEEMGAYWTQINVLPR